MIAAKPLIVITQCDRLMTGKNVLTGLERYVFIRAYVRAWQKQCGSSIPNDRRALPARFQPGP